MRWRYRTTVLVLSTAAFVVTMFGRLAISPVIPDISTEFQISNTTIGAALTAMWVAYALVQFPSGVLAERYGERIVILTSVCGTGLLALVIGNAPVFGVFVLGVVLLGAVAGLHYSVATALVTRTHDNIGTAISLHDAGGPTAGLITPVVVAWAAVEYGWRVAVSLTAAVAVVVAVLFWWRVEPMAPRRPDSSIRERFEPAAMMSLLSRPSIVFTGVLAVVVEFVWQGLASFLPTFFVQYHGFSQTTAGTLFGGYFVANGALLVGVGYVGDRFGRDTAITLCMGAGIAGLAALVGGSGLPSMVVGIVLLGVGMSWAAAIFPRFMDHIDPDDRSSGFGLVRTAYMVLAASGSVAVGALADTFGWAVAIGFLMSLLGVVLALVVANHVLGFEY